MRWLRRLTWVMMAAAAGLLVWTGWGIGSTLHNEQVQAQRWDAQTFRSNVLAASVGAVAFNHPPFAPGQQVAKMEIPRIGYVAIMLEGNSDQVLANGPGHYIGTAYPGESDTMIVSGHNTFMLGVPQLKKGDQVIFTDPDGRFTYVIDGSRIVDPSDRHAIGLNGKPTLELTTCWPIWAGAFATQRLVVYAHLVTT